MSSNWQGFVCVRYIWFICVCVSIFTVYHFVPSHVYFTADHYGTQHKQPSAMQAAFKSLGAIQLATATTVYASTTTNSLNIEATVSFKRICPAVAVSEGVR